MPYRSDAQRKFMHANYPKLARKWDSEYGGIGKLPEHAHTALLKKYGKNKEAAMKQEKHPSWANRIIAGGALLGAGHGYMRPHSAFSGGMENGGNTIKGRLAGAAVGATVGAGLGWLPKILMDAKKEQQGVKTASQARTAYLHKLAQAILVPPVSKLRNLTYEMDDKECREIKQYALKHGYRHDKQGVLRKISNSTVDGKKTAAAQRFVMSRS